MDYLPQVTVEPARQPLDVPYLCGPREEPVLELFEGGFHGEQLSTKASLEDRAASLQRRFFFGLLEEVMRPGINIVGEDFVAKSTSGSLTVSAASLPSMLEAWEIFRAKTQADGDGPRFQPAKTEALLSLATAALKHTVIELSQESKWTTEEYIHGPLPIIILSIQALIETFWDAQFSPLSWPLRYSVQNPNLFWIENRFVDRLLRSAGWLPAEISLMPKDIRFRYYLSFFSQKKGEPLRRRSSAARTKQAFSIKERYSAVHVKPNCQCKWLGSELPSGQILKESFCLVSLSGTTGSETLETHQVSLLCTENTSAFVAFSHVRSDGLGSSTANRLPQCQISLLQTLSNQLVPNGKHPIPFYIDTLCVPLDGIAKRNALRNIQHIFGLARKVLVLDTDLRNKNVGLSQENLVRIRYSLWTKRLWTVQECAVAQDVSFRFLDQNLPLNQLLHSHDIGDGLPLLQTQSLKDRNLNGFTNETYEVLSTSLALLSDDLQLAESLRHIADEKQTIHKLREGYDKWRLRVILRLGLLALPQMRYFPEGNESADFEAVAAGILAVYARLSSNCLRWSQRESISPEELYARLRKIQEIELLSYS